MGFSSLYKIWQALFEFTIGRKTYNNDKDLTLEQTHEYMVNIDKFKEVHVDFKGYVINLNKNDTNNKSKITEAVINDDLKQYIDENNNDNIYLYYEGVPTTEKIRMNFVKNYLDIFLRDADKDKKDKYKIDFDSNTKSKFVDNQCKSNNDDSNNDNKIFEYIDDENFNFISHNNIKVIKTIYYEAETTMIYDIKKKILDKKYTTSDKILFISSDSDVFVMSLLLYANFYDTCPNIYLLDEQFFYYDKFDGTKKNYLNTTYPNIQNKNYFFDIKKIYTKFKQLICEKYKINKSNKNKHDYENPYDFNYTFNMICLSLFILGHDYIKLKIEDKKDKKYNKYNKYNKYDNNNNNKATSSNSKYLSNIMNNIINSHRETNIITQITNIIKKEIDFLNISQNATANIYFLQYIKDLNRSIKLFYDITSETTQLNIKSYNNDDNISINDAYYCFNLLITNKSMIKCFMTNNTDGINNTDDIKDNNLQFYNFFYDINNEEYNNITNITNDKILDIIRSQMIKIYRSFTKPYHKKTSLSDTNQTINNFFKKIEINAITEIKKHVKFFIEQNSVYDAYFNHFNNKENDDENRIYDLLISLILLINVYIFLKDYGDGNFESPESAKKFFCTFKTYLQINFKYDDYNNKYDIYFYEYTYDDKQIQNHKKVTHNFLDGKINVIINEHLLEIYDSCYQNNYVDYKKYQTKEQEYEIKEQEFKNTINKGLKQGITFMTIASGIISMAIYKSLSNFKNIFNNYLKSCVITDKQCETKNEFVDIIKSIIL
jgi:hypothetical protein